MTWQGSQVQPDNSIRIDWVDRDQEGRDLDAISFIEQHGDTILTLDLFGVDRPYQTYNNDAEAIVGSYQVLLQKSFDDEEFVSFTFPLDNNPKGRVN